MKIIIILIFYTLITQLTTARRLRRVSKREEENLEKQHRNAICCEKKMRCCVKPAPPPIEIRAVLARCPNMKSDAGSSITRLMNRPVITANEHSIKSFQGFDEDEPLMQSRVTQCRRKVLMTLKLHHSGPINCKSQYIVIDHVYDPITEKSVRLLNPYVIKLRQEQVSKAFYLKFVDYVNSEAYEKIYNKHDGNFTGCYADKLHSTCGVVKYDGKIIPYSQGFCCSCDAAKNAERQPDSINEKNEAIISYSDPAYLLDRVQCPRNYYKEDKSNNTNCTHPATPIPPNEIGHSSCTPASTPGLEIINQPPITGPPKRWQYTMYSRKISQPTASTQISHKYLKPETGFKRKRYDQDPEIKPEEKFERSTRLEDYYKQVQQNFRKKDHKAYIQDVKKAHAPFPQSYIDQITDTFGDDIFAKRLIRKIRQTFPSGIQKRGRQNCADRYTPPGMDPEHYHESAHCLRFSDVWYGIYKLGEPFVEQSVWINIYERFESETSSDRWREITNQTLHIGNRNPMYEDETPTISITFTTETLNHTNEYSSLHSKRILIPEGVKHCDVQKYPEMKNGAEEYLVVNPEQVALEGDQCDRIGVGFEAFFKQPLRCGVPRSTCLHNQPKHLWRHDKALEKHNKRGCYFLKYHANITKDPILVNQTTGEKYLDVEYLGGHITTIDIEIKADFNAIIRQQTTAVISEVYVDSTCEKITTIIVKVINSGLISNKFMVQLSDFPLEIPTDFSRIKSKLTLVSPQNQHIFTLEVRHVLPSELLFCSVEVLNTNHELVALRRIRIQKYDRCICTWHCLCACVASSAGLKCNPMSLEHYHAAGFQGSLPIVTYMVHFTLLDDLLSVVFYFALFLLAVLLLMGLVKALLGYCFHVIGMWGLTVLLDLPKRMKKYYEPSIRHEPVVYDQDGWPIHPKTRKRVRNISRSTEFCTNLVFFFTYPLAGCLVIFRRLCCSYYTKKRKNDNLVVEKPKKRKDTSESGSTTNHPKTASSQSPHTTTDKSTSGTEKSSKAGLTVTELVDNDRKKNKKSKKAEMVNTESERSNTSKSSSKLRKKATTVGRLTVEDFGGDRKQSKCKISKTSGDKGESKAEKKSKGQHKSSKGDGAKICACEVPKIRKHSSEEKLLSTVSVYTTSTCKTPKQLKEKTSSQSKRSSRSSKTPVSTASSRTSVSSESSKSSKPPRSSSHVSKSSRKTITTLSTTTPSEASSRKHKRTAFVIPAKEIDEDASKTIICTGGKQERPKSM